MSQYLVSDSTSKPIWTNVNQEPIENNTPSISNNKLQFSNQIFDSFNQIYALAPKECKELSSYNFSLRVKQSEDLLLEAKKILKDNPKFESQILKMEQQFNELIQMMPEGPCVLLQRNIDSIRRLSQVPSNTHYTSAAGVLYHQPQVCIMDIVNHFQKFKEKHEFSAISVAMKRDNFYGSMKNKMITIVGFNNAEVMFPKVDNFLKHCNLKTKKDINKLSKRLAELATRKFEDWGFKNFSIIFSENTKGELFQRINTENQYFCFVVFFHRKVKKQGNNLIESPTKENDKQVDINTILPSIETPNLIKKPTTNRSQIENSESSKKKNLFYRCYDKIRLFLRILKNRFYKIFQYFGKKKITNSR